MKYIDAEKLIAEIKRYKNKADERLKIKGRTLGEEQKDLALQSLCGNLLHFITSLQQEPPEVDLEKEIENEWRKCHPTDEGMGLESANIVNEQFDTIAKYFYELGRNARKL